MARMPWHRLSLDRQLSAYLDGELSSEQADALNERLALDPAALALLENLSRVDNLTRLAVTAGAQTDLDDVVATLHHAAAAKAAEAPCPAGSPPGRRRLTPTLLASAGLLVTASVAYVGLRRRGLI